MLGATCPPFRWGMVRSIPPAPRVQWRDGIYHLPQKGSPTEDRDVPPIPAGVACATTYLPSGTEGRTAYSQAGLHHLLAPGTRAKGLGAYHLKWGGGGCIQNRSTTCFCPSGPMEIGN